MPTLSYFIKFHKKKRQIHHTAFRCVLFFSIAYRTTQSRSKMIQPIENLNRVIKTITRDKVNAFGGPWSKSAKPINTNEEANTKWKLAWMEVYDDLRKELCRLRSENGRVHGLLDAERITTQKKTTRNHLLQQKLKEQWESYDKKVERIKDLKRKLKELQTKSSVASAQHFADLEIHFKLQREADAQKVADLEQNLKLQQMVNEQKVAELEANFKLQREADAQKGLEERLKAYAVAKMDACTETDQEQPPIKDRNNIETKAEAKNAVEVKGVSLYTCSNCGMTTNKKSTFNDHKTEFCVAAPVKDMECQVCGKLFTRRALRIHLGGMIRSLSKGRNLQGKHSNYTMEQHQEYLNAVKVG